MSDAKFRPGDPVAVREAFPPGHVRTPYFIRGHDGVVTQLVGRFPNPEELAYGRDGEPDVPLYRVQFKQAELWSDYEGAKTDTVVVDIYEHWLERLS